ncbi:hypothetical protein DF105_00990 [Burkholderia stagnalis]|uniref:hypothetical protein n=1 Tax=Burkholderia stagnalis TaxID=1503054 RepID=UPI000F5F73E0|nr:hypothetical protein [Burkholderia stagnalis]RQZ08909.1 hypothetical protein DF105_00990 [Burkholderia stagnalis]
MATKNVDWIAIEGAYRAGADSLRTIAAAYGLSEGMIRKKAKQQGWSRDPTGTKRAIVNAHMAGSSHGGTPEGTRCAQEGMAAAANEDITDMERGLEVHRLCLARLVTCAKKATAPRDIKVITEAAALAITGIRKIRGLDTPTPADAGDIDAAIEAELAQLERRRQAGVAADAEGEEPA